MIEIKHKESGIVLHRVEAETLERADRLGSGGIPVQVVPLNQGYVLVQGQETGENLMKVSVLTGIKTYWSESYR